MLIPEYKPVSAAPTAEFVQLTQLEQYKKIRAATTDKVIVILFSADWDESSRVLKEMLSERVRHNFGTKTILFNWVDCDQAEDLVEHFDVESVPSLAIVLSHKQNYEVLPGVTPEKLTEKVTELDNFIQTLFEQEKKQAFREIEDLVTNNPIMLFIKGTLDAPKCKFTRKLVETLRPREYRNIKTFDILGDERIRQWLKFYTDWPTFPQIYVQGKFLGGLDIVCELIEEGEFDDLLPENCKKLSPKDALQEFLTTNKVVVFESEADREASDRLKAHFEALSVTHARVRLYERADFQQTLLEHATEFGYKGAHLTQIYIAGSNIGTAAEACAMQESQPPTLANYFPAGYIKESLEQRLTKLVNQHDIMLFMKGSPEAPQCQFSTKIINLLNGYVGTVIPSFGYFDIFQDEEVRQGMKSFSNWPTFPQLYVKGKFVGGLDVCVDLHEERELEDVLTGKD